jgi:aldehyde:ferredoxin oxidoreductase
VAGWTGNLLKVDLTTRTSTVEKLPEATLAAWLGGRGLGAHLLYKNKRHLLDPFDPLAPVIIAAGPLSGSGIPGSSRTSMTALSPLTDTVFDSNCGGHIGIRLKRAGFDALWIEGEADAPLTLAIDSEGVKFLDAGDLWGLGNIETTERLKKLPGKSYASLTIGPAGENGSLMANINQGGRFFGRGGLGAVFGRKKLKALCVAGRGKFTPADREGFKFVADECRKLIAANPITSRGLPQFGTPVLMNVMNSAGALPSRNFRESSFEAADRIGAEAIRDTIAIGSHGCPGCTIRCGRMVKADGREMEGPEFETLWAFGANLGIDDLEGIATLNAMANDLGFDTVSAGSTIAAARELFEMGKLDFDPLDRGVEGLLELLGDIAFNGGRGAKLKDASRILCEEAGAPELSMSVKGLEMPAYDPRGCQGQGLAYATSNRGGCHLRAYMIAPEILAVPKLVDRFATSGKAGLVIVSQNINAAVDSLVLCRFTSFALRDDYYARLLKTATGLEVDAQGLMTVGERIYTLERLINMERGVDADLDRLPPRLLSEPMTDGPGKGKVVELGPMLEEYYRFRGWDAQGRPTPEKLKALGFEEVISNV